MVFHIGYEIGEAIPLMIAGAAVMHIAKGALDRVGLGTVGRHKEQRHPRVSGQPLLHGLGLMDLELSTTT